MSGLVASLPASGAPTQESAPLPQEAAATAAPAANAIEPATVQEAANATPQARAIPHARGPSAPAQSAGPTQALAEPPDDASDTQDDAAPAPSVLSAAATSAGTQAQPPVQVAVTETPGTAAAAPRPATRAAAAAPRATTPAATETPAQPIRETAASPEPGPLPADPATATLAPAPQAPAALPKTLPDAAPAAGPAVQPATGAQPHAAEAAPEPPKAAGKPATDAVAHADGAQPVAFSMPDAGAATQTQPQQDAPATVVSAAATPVAKDAQQADQATPASTTAATPATQLAHAVASLHVGADGTSHTTIKLDPAELGQMQIRISRAQDGTSSVSVAVERPDTLATLQNDLGHLHQALDRAGISDQRSVTLHLAATDQPGSQTTGSGAGSMAQGGFQQGARQERQQGGPVAKTASFATPATSDPSTATVSPRRTQTAGVNITA